MTAMPDRLGVVARVCGEHPEVFQGPIGESDDRRRAFLPTIIRALNVVDGGAWGLLVKTDQGDKIPADIAVWHPTMDHVDVMTDTGAAWIPKGVVSNPAWIWRAVDPIEPPPPPPSPPPDDLLALVTQISMSVQAIGAALVEVLRRQEVLATQMTELLARPTPTTPPFTAPIYRGSLFGISIVLRPDPPPT